MKQPYRHIVLLALLLSPLSLWAQEVSNSGLLFATLSHDYGHISEAEGVVTCRFTATNTTTEDIVIIDIITTCGCTTARYEGDTIAPHENFNLDISFDPTNRPGRIDRHIYIHVSDTSDSIPLHITGYVQARERTIEELYPFDMGGGLRVETTFHAFGYVEESKSVEHSIGYVNTSNRSIHLSLEIATASGYLDTAPRITIAPHATGDIVLRYSNSTPIYGIVEDRIEVLVDGKASSYDLATQAIMVDNFDMVDDISAPRLVISKNIIKFGEVNGRNDILERSVELKNEGATSLLVRAIECSAPAVVVVGDASMSIAPGASATITLALRSAYIEDWDNPFVGRAMVITNDPLRPMQTIRLTALPM